MDLVDKWTSVLGNKNPFSKKAQPEEHIIWLLDNAAYRPTNPNSQDPQPWQAEFIACYFTKNRKDLKKKVGAIAYALGIDTKQESNRAVTARIARRLEPFVNPIAPARRVAIQIPDPTGGPPRILELGPSNSQGISVQTLTVSNNPNIASGTVIESTTANPFTHPVLGKTRFVSPDGWGIISDIDDTIKVTQEPAETTTTNNNNNNANHNPANAILHRTFADAAPQPVADMPGLYGLVHARFSGPAWFYVSASPYNLYPFLGGVLHAAPYPPGVLVLRDHSWQTPCGLLRSLTQGVRAYKTARIARLHAWFPRRAFVCFGDSTQSDPEVYADMYRRTTTTTTTMTGRFGSSSSDDDDKGRTAWIRAIFIRKVVYADAADARNRPERFERAFRGVPRSVWMVFERPEECVGRLMRLLEEEDKEGEGESEGSL